MEPKHKKICPKHIESAIQMYEDIDLECGGSTWRIQGRNFRSCIYMVLQDVKPGLGISKKAIHIIDKWICNVLDALADGAAEEFKQEDGYSGDTGDAYKDELYLKSIRRACGWVLGDDELGTNCEFAGDEAMNRFSQANKVETGKEYQY